MGILEDFLEAFRLMERTVVVPPDAEPAVSEAVEAAGLAGAVTVQVSEAVKPGTALVFSQGALDRALATTTAMVEREVLPPSLWSYGVALNCGCLPGLRCWKHEPPNPRSLVIITGV